MTEHEIMAAKYANTAFAILYEPRNKTPPQPTKEMEILARRKRNNDRSNALRAAKNKCAVDNKTKANWTI